MRIHHHLSIILFVAIVGAIGPAVAVGVLLEGLERAAHESGKAADQHRQVELLVIGSRSLLDATNSLTTRSSEESFAIVDQAIEQSMVQLVKLRHAPLVFEVASVERAIQALERSRQLALSPSAGVRHPDELSEFRDSAAAYVTSVGQLERSAAVAASGQAERLAQRRRTIMLAIGVICLIYLAVIERVRHWTTRRLIHPMQQLADAARQVMKGGGASPRLEYGNTTELITLADLFASLADTVKANVRQRTGQVERQKEILEKEVRIRRRAEEQLRYAAFHDKLTGLCNRDLLMDRLGRCFERAGRREGYQFGVLFIDLDQFKEVNDRLGHFIGDQLLIGLAERYQQCLRETDEVTCVESSTLSRLGGDEFVVLLDGLKAPSDAGLVAERLQQALDKPFQLQGHEVYTTSSIGIAFYEVECGTPEHLLRNADAAMYYAKAGGKGQHNIFSKGVHDQATARLEMGNEFRRALENGEFRVVFQPIISLKTARLSGFEALARWDHPQRGPISPVEFIANAEETGAIIQLDQWVLEQACRQLRKWNDQLKTSQSLSVSVNVSTRHVAHPRFVDDVQDVLRSTKLEGANLKLEITESVIMENPNRVAEVLRRLKELGVEIHMDDFGTGYSSLSYLHRLPIDVLKIDREFMSTLSTNNNYADVVHTVVALARTLQMEVTVEGVENESQLAQLMALDCSYAQGYYFSEPLNAESAMKIIASEPRWLPAAA